MKKNKKAESENLRQKAEALLKKNARKTSATLSEIDMLKLIHELEVHQVELELQNDELQRARELADIATDKFTNLYDFAPSGYLTLSPKGDIVELNLESSKILGQERSKLMNKKFGLFVSSDTRSIFNQFLVNAFESKKQETCEVALSNDGGVPTYVLLTGILSENNGRCNVTMVDITKRKQAEEELVGTKFVLDTTTDAVYWMQQDGQFVDVNDAACKKLGYTRDELLAMHVNDMNPDYPTHRWPATWELIKQEKSVSIEAHHKTKDGLVFPVEIQANYVQFGDKERICSYVRDITERKQAEEMLASKNTTLKLTGEIAKIGGWSLDLLSNMMDFSPEALLINDVDPNNGLTLDQAFSMIHPEDRAGQQAAVEMAIKNGTPWDRELRMTTAKGRPIWVRTQGVAEMKNGKATKLHGYFQDITDRRQAELGLSNAKDSLEQAQKSAKLGSWEMDAVTKKLSWSKQMFQILEVNPDEEPSFELYYSRIHPDDLSYVQEVGARVYADNEAAKAEYRLQMPSGSIKHIATEGYREFEGDEVVKLTGIVQDITERKQAEEAIKNSRDQLRKLSRKLDLVREEERTRIAGEIHDDLGQALTALTFDLLSVQEKMPKSDKEQHKKIATMLVLVSNLSIMIQRISLDLRPPTLNDLGLASTLQWQIDEFQNRTGIECQLDLESVENEIDQIASTVIYRIFQEALTNIARHAEATQVKATLTRQGKNIELIIIDNGKGISKEQLGDNDSLGIIGMRERCLSCDGTLKINGVQGQGTTITMSIPVA